jgi:hypothetical protein
MPSSCSRAVVRLALLLAVACAPTSLALSAPAWIPSSDPVPRPVQVELEEARPGSLSAHVSVPGFLGEAVERSGRLYARLELLAGDRSGQIGQPALPVVRMLVEVPPGAALDVRLEEVSGVWEQPLVALGLPGQVVPLQPPVPKRPDADPPGFVIDETAYSRTGFHPAGAVEVVARAMLRGRELALVELRPVRYDPARGLVRLWSSARLVVEATAPDVRCSERASDRLADQLGAGIVLGSLSPCAAGSPARDGFGTAGPGPAEGLLVIVHDDFAAAIDPFVDWKERTGWKVDVRQLSEIAAEPTDVDVKNVIQQAYDTWTDPSLGYVLLVGDTDFTPIHQGNGGGHSQVTDNWYACLDGPDYLPDVGISRISTRSVAETENVVDKLMTYERATFASDDWTKRAGFIGTSDSGYIGMIEDTHDWCIDSFYTPNDYEATSWSHGYESCDRHYHTYDADTSEIAASIDEGRAMVNYSGHGSTTSWQGPTSHGGYDQSDVRNNTNDDMYPFVISNACVTGRLDATECFGETWQKEPDRGAIGFLGASNNSYWNEDDYFQRRLHAHLFPMDETPPLSIVVNRAKLDLYDHYGDTGTVAYYFDMYNLLSEPTLTMWTRRPRMLTVSYDEQIPAGSTEFSVTVQRAGAAVEGELVAVRKQDEGILSAGYTDATGSVTLLLDPAPLEPGPMEVTVTGHDDRPHEGSTEVVPADGPWLRLVAHEVDDADAGCDFDGVADIGENALFTLTVENIGAEPAVDAWVDLDSSADVAVLDGPASLGTVAAGQTAPGVLTVRIGANVACRELASFRATMGCAGADPRTDTFVEELEVDHVIDTDLEDLERAGAEPPGWSHEALVGTDDWAIGESANHTPGGQWSYHAGEVATQKDVVLLTDPLEPNGEATLRFWQLYDLTSGKSGAAVELSADGGTSWIDLGSAILTHPYTHFVGQGTERREVWSGDSGGWVETEIDLSAWSGETVTVRFRIGGVRGTGTGWWIDDVSLESDFVGCDTSACGIPAEIAAVRARRELEETVLRWEDDPVAATFRVWRSTTCSTAESFTDVTDLDDDPSDDEFADPFAGAFACWIVQGVGPDGDGPWGHFGR